MRSEAGSANFSCKEPGINILGFVCHKVSVATTQLHCRIQMLFDETTSQQISTLVF